MTIRILAAAGLLACSLLPVQVAAQTPASSTAAGTEASAPAKRVSDADKAAWAQCKTMTKEAMTKDATCSRILKTYSHSGTWSKSDAAKPNPDKK